MCFARMIIPSEKYWNNLSLIQKYPLIVFIYESDVLGEGHIGFLDLNSSYISLDDLEEAMNILDMPDAYMDIIANLPWDYCSIDSLIEQSKDEEDFASKMDELDEVFEQYDKAFYELDWESTEIRDRILMYLREHFEEFFRVE